MAQAVKPARPAASVCASPVPGGVRALGGGEVRCAVPVDGDPVRDETDAVADRENARAPGGRVPRVPLAPDAGDGTRAPGRSTV